MVQDDPAYEDYKVNDWDLGDHFRVVLKHKHDSKETISTALLNRDGKKPVDFGLSLGDMVIDEGMHRAMKLKNFDALLVQSDAEVKGSTQTANHLCQEVGGHSHLIDCPTIEMLSSSSKNWQRPDDLLLEGTPLELKL
ncbi:hypothetical protein KEM48_012618 [Puccinia striiformis f. sp. tritici PST-130]|nr:hypothetical protein KEM48_012618 [Puccinia striiformis f. sp. tritici PST-130]